ncbi:hypothetical protein H2O64_13035 [Kordia sp. YSTF-M3]|uniref:Uncharacterized protein n=1 Tax=Kordia aestuariivivens TaxID=2759037 RepID=A0ABR7QAJ8_9FLAO|nr:hypothetical protein [Kordia aestuariivivens]MBC8755595.1 hypothetical protein [Kordia aestuariivivens]
MKTLLRGNIHFTEKREKWTLEIDAKWNKKINTITIKARKSNLVTDFSPCKLYKSNFFTILSYVWLLRSESYGFSGKKSEFSEILLESAATIPLMETKNPIIKLEGKHLIFSGGIRKKDSKSLSNVLTLVDMLLSEIDEAEHNH